MTETNTASAPTVFKPGTDLTIAQVGEAHRQLRDLLEGKPEDGLYLDLAAVSRVDAAGIQLLVALTQEARNTGLPLAWSPPPPAIHEAAAALGLLPMLGFSASTPEE